MDGTKRTLIKIEREASCPLEIEINGRRLTGAVERTAFFAAVVLAGTGTLFLIVYVLLPLVGILIAVVLAIIGVKLLILGTIAVIAIIGVLASGILERRSRDSRQNSDCER